MDPISPTPLSSWTSIATLVLNLLTLIAVTLVLPLWKMIQKLRENDLKHLDEQLEEIKRSIHSVDEKLDQHINYHLEKKI